MRRIILFVPLLFFIGIGLFLWKGLQLDPKALPSALLDKPFPTFKLSSLKDSERILQQIDIQGEPALVNVWATWCTACKQEHGQLNIIQSEGYRLIGINYKDKREEAQLWLENNNSPYLFNIFDDKGRLGIDLGVYGIPESYIIDAKGVIRYKHVGIIDDRQWKKMKSLLNMLRKDKGKV